jgi:hypothetical protein
MIGAGLEGADLESRLASWAASVTSDDAAAVRAVHGATGRSRSACASRCRSSQEGTAPASSEARHPDSRVRLRSPGTTRLRLRRYLPARTGAVQVDVGVAGAVRVPARGALALLGHGPRPPMH